MKCYRAGLIQSPQPASWPGVRHSHVGTRWLWHGGMPDHVSLPGEAIMKVRALCAVLTAVGLCACGSTKVVKHAPPPPVDQTMAQSSSPHLAAKLEWVIVPGGPGAWVTNAGWDEYLIRVRNTSTAPVRIDGVEVEDSSGQSATPLDSRAALIKASRKTARRYRDEGVKVQAGMGRAAPLAAGGVGSTTAGLVYSGERRRDAWCRGGNDYGRSGAGHDGHRACGAQSQGRKADPGTPDDAAGDAGAGGRRAAGRICSDCSFAQSRAHRVSRRRSGGSRRDRHTPGAGRTAPAASRPPRRPRLHRRRPCRPGREPILDGHADARGLLRQFLPHRVRPDEGAPARSRGPYWPPRDRNVTCGTKRA